jgi:N-methylhydantoinase A
VFRIGIDVGGTFTDLIAVDDAGNTTVAKVPSTPDDPSRGVMAGLGRLAALFGITPAALLAASERIVHGTTVATNALLERKGAIVGMLTTEGHRDVIEMREGLKDDRYNLRVPPPEPLVPRQRRLGVRERVRSDGRIETPLDPASLAAAIAGLQSAGVGAVAVCYLHAYRDPRHEQATAAALAAAMPGAYVSLSSDIHPRIGEFERFSTTVVNAYVGPAMVRYLTRLAKRLAEAGYGGSVLMIQSHGGVLPIAEAQRLAAGSVLSGPAGGVAGGEYAARLLATPELIAFDMGGTSTDICLITDGEAALGAGRRIGGARLALSSLDIVSLGAGGGSIARVDAGGILHVGPESAGADPGPACYGRGGRAATVTDANLVLGYLDPAHFLGGSAPLDLDLAARALDRLAGDLDVDRIAAAAGVHRVINTTMAEGIRLVSVRRGVDPRRFALLAFGGAAGLHVTAVARELDVARVVVPRLAAVLSAWGMLSTDLRVETSRTHIGDIGRLDGATVKRLFEAMEEEGRARLASSFAGTLEARRAAEMRYGEQIFAITVPLEGVDWKASDPLPQLAECFHRRHEELYTYALRDQEPVFVNARSSVIGRLPALPREPVRPAAAPTAPAGERQIHLGAWVVVPVYALDHLAPGQCIEGTAIVESATTTVLLREGDTASVNPLGWLDIAVAPKTPMAGAISEMDARRR